MCEVSHICINEWISVSYFGVQEWDKDVLEKKKNEIRELELALDKPSEVKLEADYICWDNQQRWTSYSRHGREDNKWIG